MLFLPKRSRGKYQYQTVSTFIFVLKNKKKTNLDGKGRQMDKDGEFIIEIFTVCGKVRLTTT